MSDLGIFLLLFAVLCAIVAIVRFFAWLTDIIESGGFRAALARQVGKYLQPKSVRPYQLPAAPPARYVAPAAPEKPQTAQTDGQTDRVSVADEWLDRLEVDRTRATWVELMVYIGYSGSEIRTLMKGDNAAIGKDVDAARKKLGMEPTITPIAGRPTDARYPERPEVELAS